jgi:perosamine synthetase
VNIPQMIPFFDQAESEALSKYMETGGFLTEFLETSALENEIADFVKVKHVIMVNNGTLSLYVMLKMLNIGPGDEVIVPNYTMIATPNAVEAVGAEPIFVDVEMSSLCMDIAAVKNAVTSKTKAVLFVSPNGRSPSYPIEDLIDFCKSLDLVFLEDAAQGLGSYYANGAHVGTLGLMGSFSFSVPKIITMGQGGCIITNDDEMAKKIRAYKDFGRSRGGIDIHESIGLNFKITDLQAVIGRVQMAKLPFRVERKKEIWLKYAEVLEGNPSIQLFHHNLDLVSPWFIDSMVENRDELISYLKDRGIGTRKMYPPINSQVAYNKIGSYPNSELVGQKGLWLPSFVQLTDEEIQIVGNAIRDFYQV